MVEKYTWVGIPEHAVTLDECKIFEEKPDMRDIQKAVGGLFQGVPKSQIKVKGIKLIYVNEEGQWMGYDANKIVNSMLGGGYNIVSKMGVLNRNNFPGGGFHVTRLNEKHRGSLLSHTGQKYSIVGPALAQVRLSKLEAAINDMRSQYPIM